MFTTRDLFQRAMKSDWNNILEMCRNYPDNLTVKITPAGDTLLHLAVYDGKELEVKQIVELITEQGNETAKINCLRAVNERKNTALHIAASMGNVNMCRWIAEVEPNIIGARNVDGETPFFLTTVHGKLKAFLCLHFICLKKGNNGIAYARRGGGETILHSAIRGDYFELAFVIINLYGDLIDYRSEEGMSSLHLLATKSTVFCSGSPLGWFESIIYHCIIVEDMKHDATLDKPETLIPSFYVEKISTNHHKYPPNYGTCFSFFHLFYKMFRVPVSTSKGKNENKNEKAVDAENPSEQQGLFPPNYGTCFEGMKLMYKAMLIFLGLGSKSIVKLREKKERHSRAVQIMNLLMENTRIYEYYDSGGNPGVLPTDETLAYTLGEGGSDIVGPTPYILTEDQPFPLLPDYESEGNGNGNGNNHRMEMDHEQGMGKTVESPLLLAARHGVKEMVEKIVENFPVAIYDVNSDKKNILLVAVESRQPHVYQFLLERETMKDGVFSKVDKHGNSALHLAATLHDHVPWLIPGAALQMQWEIKWYEFVKTSVPAHFFSRYNKAGETPKDIFTRSHRKLVTEGGEWLTKTSESCSVLAALIAAVAFATSTTVPGGVDKQKGIPILEGQPAFNVYAIASLVALCVSVTALVMFLSILTSRYQEKDFRKALPRKLLTGLLSLFISIAAMLVSFCAGHFFILIDKLKYEVYPIYAVTCLPIMFFAVAQFPLYFDLIRATFKKVPQRSYKMVPKLEDEKKGTQSKLIEDGNSLIREARESLKLLSNKSNKDLQRAQSTRSFRFRPSFRF